MADSSFDWSSFMNSLNGGNVGEYGKYAAQGLKESFQPRYTQASENVYNRGFNKQGSMYNSGLAPLDSQLFAQSMQILPDMYFKQQGLTNQSNQIANNYDLGLKSNELSQNTLDYNKGQSMRGSLGKMFGF